MKVLLTSSSSEDEVEMKKKVLETKAEAMRDLLKEHDDKAMNEDETERKTPITRRMPWS